MRTSKQKLKQIITEEIQKALKEAGKTALQPVAGAGVQKATTGIQSMQSLQSRRPAGMADEIKKAKIVRLLRHHILNKLSVKEYAQIVRLIYEL